jgi:16S rRNA (cytosine1402-N4)-methyltransferase
MSDSATDSQSTDSQSTDSSDLPRVNEGGDIPFTHIPVLSKELIEGVVLRPAGVYLDATVGGGGHSELILAAALESCLVAIDQDEQAIAAAQMRLAKHKERVKFWHGNFADYDPGGLQFDGIVADLGVSSAQFDIPNRGFSFRHDAPLDMRMNQQQSLTAAEVINHWDEAKLAEIFYVYGEERLSRRIARRIVERRPLKTTTELAETIFYCVPKSYRYARIHPATRVFQALRIAVNQELAVLEKFLNLSPLWLKPGGRIGVISFHSLEDRIVKYTFRESELLQVLTKKPIVPQEEEMQRNVRSRSAKLRLAERLV